MRMDMNMNVFGILWGCLVWFGFDRELDSRAFVFRGF